MRKKKLDILDILGLFIIAVVLVLSFIRLFLGAEMTDEAYCVAENYLVSQGALPFVNNWSQMPGYTLLLAPFIKLYCLINGGTEGIVIFNRLLCFIISATVALVIAELLKKYVERKVILFLCVLPYVGLDANSLLSFRGDNLALLFYAIGVLILIRNIMGDFQVSMLVLSGMLLALGVFCYPTLLLQYIYVFVLLIIFKLIKRQPKRGIAFFVLGSFVAAVIVTTYLVGNSGVLDLVNGIKCLLNDVTYFQLKNDGIAKLPIYIRTMLTEFIVYLRISFLIMFVLFMVLVILTLCRKCMPKLKETNAVFSVSNVKRALFLGFTLGILGDLLYQIYRFQFSDNNSISLNAVTMEFIAVSFLWLFIRKGRKIADYLMIFVWIPNIIWVISTGVVTYSKIYGRNWMLINAAYLVGIFTVWGIQDWFLKPLKEEKETILNKFGCFCVSLIPIIIMAGVTMANLFNAYTTVYRDAPVYKLTTRINTGAYKGVYTTEERAEGLVQLERIIREYTDANDYILAMDNDPFIYLMTEGKICAPCTWDMALYSYHFDAPELYYDYFDAVGREPTKIIYMNYGRDAVLSIDTEYQFNSFTKQNYHLIYENRNLSEWNYGGRDVPGELLIYERNT